MRVLWLLGLTFAASSTLIMHEFMLNFLINSNEEITLRLSSASAWRLLYFVSLMNYILKFIIAFLEQIFWFMNHIIIILL